MRQAQRIVLVALVVSYLLPWQVYLFKDGSGRSNLVTGVELCSDLATFAYRYHDMSVEDADGNVTYPYWDDAAVAAVFLVVFSLPCLIAPLPLARLTILARRSRRTAGLPLTFALVISAGLAYVLSVRVRPYELPTRNMVWEVDRFFVIHPLLCAPLICLVFALTFGILQVARRIRRRRRKQAWSTEFPPGNRRDGPAPEADRRGPRPGAVPTTPTSRP
ncbi:MAG: hypothetical protein AMS16_03910 [Planctomycetes bacterium DG_58]|nr:MAG: hypothetical protein AMS16_03910 [Planctomycetes bacterium DG_58]